MEDLYTQAFELKRQLYLILLRKDPKQITEEEMNIMFAISQDREIQKFIESKLEGK